MSYMMPPMAHASMSSAITQTVASTTAAYPLILETLDDVDGISQKSGTVTIDIATPAVVRWTAHGLAIGEAVMFATTGALPTGLAVGTVYYIITAGFGVDSFRVSATFGGTAVNTSGTQSGTQTARCVSRIYVPEAGDYLVNISALVDCTNNTASYMDIWFDLNGAILANSNTQVAVNSSNIQAVVAIPLIIDLEKDEYCKIVYHGSTTTIQFLAVAAASNPVRPACPSVIVTINKVGR